jgi:hypothetical protein
MNEDKIKRDLELKKKEKIEDSIAKQKIKKQIELDKLERKSKFGGVTTSEVVSVPPQQALKTSSESKGSTIRSLNGSVSNN